MKTGKFIIMVRVTPSEGRLIPRKRRSVEMRMIKRSRASRAKIVLGLCLLLFFAACAHGPVLYPNTYLKRVGQEQAQKDIKECDHLAEEYVKSDAGLQAAESTAIGAGAGAVVGGAMGSVVGSFGRGAALGGVGGAASGLIHGLVRSSEPSPVHKNFVIRCLQEKGYEPVGWE
jgi:outer membrane lipoprotein SlyB